MKITDCTLILILLAPLLVHAQYNNQTLLGVHGTMNPKIIDELKAKPPGLALQTIKSEMLFVADSRTPFHE